MNISPEFKILFIYFIIIKYLLTNLEVDLILTPYWLKYFIWAYENREKHLATFSLLDDFSPCCFFL